MGILAAIKRLAFSFLVTFNWAYSFFSRRPKLHGSRFARIDELTNLTTHDLDREGSLILGVSREAGECRLSWLVRTGSAATHRAGNKADEG